MCAHTFDEVAKGLLALCAKLIHPLTVTLVKLCEFQLAILELQELA